MDLYETFSSLKSFEAIKSIDMHTAGEATRIVYDGFPDLRGSLLDQREEAEKKYDDLRKRIILEPRGHFDMYGAILRPQTELVESGEADIGALFIHNGGFSTMCGHATIALGRFLVDTSDENAFPNRSNLRLDTINSTAEVRIHVPCGLVVVTVPTNSDGTKSDPSRPVSFLSTPAFTAARDMEVEIPTNVRWKELGSRSSINFDLAYGGAYYALISAKELGFTNGLKEIDLLSVTSCIRKLKPFLASHPAVIDAIRHPDDSRLSYLYSIMIVDSNSGYHPEAAVSVESGLCYFADNEIDRSPTGSCVSARVALAYDKRQIELGEKRAYNSLITNHFEEGAFIGSVAEVLNESTIIAQVEGYAFYIGSSLFIWEKGDRTSREGFIFDQCV
ncbi:LAFE_0H00408g1_1 [Lachancea fermentati]|uniref:trans-L-3-hydroxyproline dehydratase n=1 Tax=Lachancea fermentati TaxID=4955 RepID=A0A1G4MIX0_LACFM|nr:LAFE_0H00408g1_1 [Lachancea fermentati]